MIIKDIKIDKKILQKHGLDLKEYQKIKNILEREPNLLELGMFSILWSEHCSYKSSKKLLKKLPVKGSKVLEGPGENAGVIDIGDGFALIMKIESHNHPSFIEPFQGAATGVGGIIRDILAMGGKPIALLNSLRFGKYKNSRFLFQKVISGISFYGNCVGIPNVGGEIYFEDCYEQNPLVNVMCVGIVEKKNIIKAVAKGIGNVIIYYGASTGKDGISGASFASKELNKQSKNEYSSIQIADPFLGKLLIEGSLDLAKKDYVIGIQDMGAGGLTGSCAEMSSRGSCGMNIDLSKIPLREKNMNPYEIMLSESQERMLVVIKKGFENLAIKILKKWSLEPVVIGEVIQDEKLNITFQNKLVGSVPIKALTEGFILINKYKNLKKPSYLNLIPSINNIKLEKNYNKALLKLLKSDNLINKSPVYNQYDYMVQTNTVISPGLGDSAVIRIKGTKKGIAMTTDSNSIYCYLDPYRGSKIAVAEASRNLSAVGAVPVALTDGLNFGNPTDEKIYWQMEQSILGIKEASEILEIPVISGNVSLYNETVKKSIYPTPIIGMIGIINDINEISNIAFKKSKDLIFLLGNSLEELGASEYSKLIDEAIVGECPSINLKLEKRIQKTCRELIKKKLINSAHDISEGGLAIALSECCLSGKLGANIIIDNNIISKEALLFGESQSRIIISCNENYRDHILSFIKKESIPYSQIGKVTQNRYLMINKDINLSLDDLTNNFNGFMI